MAMRLSAVQVNGDMIHFEVTPEKTGRELKRQIRAEQIPDEVTRSTTVVGLLLETGCWGMMRRWQMQGLLLIL